MLVLGLICLGTGTAALCAGPALADVVSQPGSLTFSPGSGPTTATPSWSVSGGCPAGYLGSAQMAIFDSHGKFISLISNVAYGVTSSFSGELDGTMAAILKFANVPKGGSLEFAVGCDSQTGGTGNTTWIQAAMVTLSSNGKSYTTSASSTPSVNPAGASTGQRGSAASNGNNAQGLSATDAANSGGGVGSGALAAWIAGPFALLAAIAGFIVYRRRQDRSRLM